jgi:hypothetical protein
MGVYSTELGIRLSFVKTSEFFLEGGGLNRPKHPSPRYATVARGYTVTTEPTACNPPAIFMALLHYPNGGFTSHLVTLPENGAALLAWTALNSWISACYHGAACCHENGGYRFLRSDTKYIPRRHIPEARHVPEPSPLMVRVKI